MASWQWFYDSIPGTQFTTDGGGSFTNVRPLLQGESVQRVIGQQGFWNSCTVSGTGGTGFVPFPFRWQMHVDIVDGTETYARVIEREGLMQQQLWVSEVVDLMSGFATWSLPQGALDYDVTVRHKMQSASGGSVTSYVSLAPATPTNVLNFVPPDGPFGGTWYLGCLRTASG